MVITRIINFIELITFDFPIRFVYFQLAKNYFNSTQKEPVFFDVGANVGQSIKNFKFLSRKSQVISFEADGELASDLRKRFSYVEVINAAVTNFDGETTFYKSKLNLTSALSIPNVDSARFRIKSKLIGEKGYTLTSANAIKLDTFIEIRNLPLIHFLKIDVEGSEFEVLEGAKRYLQSGRVHFVQIEVHENDYRGDESNKAENLLLALGFKKIYRIRHLIGRIEDRIYVYDKPSS